MSSHESPQRTLIVACVLCIVCSIIVSGTAVALKDLQQENKLLDKKRNILVAAGLLAEQETAGPDHLKRLFENIEVRQVELSSGQYVTDVPSGYDHLKASKEPDQSRGLTSAEDLAGIKRLEVIGTVYLTKDASGAFSRVILPVRGYGLWSTLYGFLALEADLKTVAALSFYQHAETPGLGGEVDNPGWKAHWAGKLVFNEQDQPSIKLHKGKVTPAVTGHEYKFDSLAGATLTSQGVENLLRFWVGDLGYGPYLKQLKSNSDA